MPPILPRKFYVNYRTSHSSRPVVSVDRPQHNCNLRLSNNLTA